MEKTYTQSGISGGVDNKVLKIPFTEEEFLRNVREMYRPKKIVGPKLTDTTVVLSDLDKGLRFKKRGYAMATPRLTRVVLPYSKFLKTVKKKRTIPKTKLTVQKIALPSKWR